MTEDGETTRLVREIRHLRAGRGLSLNRLEQCPALLAILGVELPLKQAHAKFLRVLDGLGDDTKVDALRTALNLPAKRMDPALVKPPGFLTARRTVYGELNGQRTTEAVEDWENDAIGDLVTALLLGTEAPPNDFTTLLVSGLIEDRRLKSLTTLGGPDLAHLDVLNLQVRQDEDAGAAPFMFFQLPESWHPATLHLVLYVIGDSPQSVHFIGGPDINSINFTAVHRQLEFSQHELAGSVRALSECSIGEPPPGHCYGLYWEW